MATEDLGEGTPKEAGATPQRPVARQWLLGLIGVVLIGLAALGIFLMVQPEPAADPAELRAGLAESWKDANRDAASGVDFEMRLKGDLGGRFTMVFDHEGKVTLKDSCHEAQSDYLVRSNGSIAIEDLSHAKPVGESLDCEDRPIGALYWTASLDYVDGGWTARDPDGEPILEKIQEDRVDVTIESDSEE